MDDFNTNLLSEARNEYSSRLLNILTPLVIQGFKSIFKEVLKGSFFFSMKKNL